MMHYDAIISMIMRENECTHRWIEMSGEGGGVDGGVYGKIIGRIIGT